MTCRATIDGVACVLADGHMGMHRTGVADGRSTDVFDVAMTQCQAVVRDGEGNAIRSCMFLAGHDGSHSYETKTSSS